MILAGDVGGTKVHLALYDFTDGKLTYKHDKQFPAKDYVGAGRDCEGVSRHGSGHRRLFWRARPGAQWPPAPDQPALDAGQPRTVKPAWALPTFS